MSARECPCGIARVDCEYHRPEPEAKGASRLSLRADNGANGWREMQSWEEPYEGKFLTSDGYVRVYSAGKLIDEYSASL